MTWKRAFPPISFYGYLLHLHLIEVEGFLLEPPQELLIQTRFR
jgi:hypothetical protein